MGGGPSASEREAERRAQEAQRRLEEERRAAQAQAQQFITIAQQEDPLETRLRARDMGWLDWESQKDGPLDVSKAPLGPALGLYDRAVNQQQGERQGIGALRMGLNASDPGLSQLLNQQSRDRRQQDASGGLEQAVRMRSAEVNRSALPLADFAQGRRMGIASLASGNANAAGGLAGQALGNYLQFAGRPRPPSFWQQLIGGALQAGGQVASTKIQFGCVTLDTKILTPSGYTPIGALHKDDIVTAVTRGGSRVPLPIIRERETFDSDVLRVENTDGGTVEVSPSDRIMLSADDRSELFASELVEGQSVAGAKIHSIEKLPEKKTVKIIKVGNLTENYGLIDGAGMMHLDDYAERTVNV